MAAIQCGTGLDLSGEILPNCEECQHIHCSKTRVPIIIKGHCRDGTSWVTIAPFPLRDKRELWAWNQSIRAYSCCPDYWRGSVSGGLSFRTNLAQRSGKGPGTLELSSSPSFSPQWKRGKGGVGEFLLRSEHPFSTYIDTPTACLFRSPEHPVMHMPKKPKRIFSSSKQKLRPWTSINIAF